MCGRFTSLLSPELLAAIFDVVPPPAVEPRYNIAPTQQVWVVRSAGDHNRLDHMKWGLIPSWAKDPKIGNQLINARSETVHEKPAFRHAIKYNRCIIPANGFYEWLHIGDRKQPNYIHMADNGPMAFAGLWEQWKEPGDANLLETFTILTTAANELLAPIHDRMPVILHVEDYGLWLNKNMHDPEELRRLYQPFQTDLLAMYRVPDLVNNPRFDSPTCIVQV
jgi:putative SOS response-associated peptidase YedK